MNTDSRASIAYLAGCLITERDASAVFDLNRGRLVNISGLTRQGMVNVYDNERQCHISGRGQQGVFKLYDFGKRAYVDLRLTGNEFSGLDQDSSSQFKGHVDDLKVILSDDQDSSRNSYILCVNDIVTDRASLMEWDLAVATDESPCADAQIEPDLETDS